MRILFAWSLALLLTDVCAFAAPPDDTYHLGPDSEPYAGVPQGKVIGPAALPSQVYPNTTRDYWVYVPAQYDAARPACLMIFCDGHAYVGLKGNYRIPYVFDNLIYRKEMPVTIGVFINPGHRPDQKEAIDADWGDRTTNRRVEYNALDLTHVRRFILRPPCDSAGPALNSLVPQTGQPFAMNAPFEDHRRPAPIEP